MFDPTSNGDSLGRGNPLSSIPAEFLLVREDPDTRNGPGSRLHALSLSPPNLDFGCVFHATDGMSSQVRRWLCRELV